MYESINEEEFYKKYSSQLHLLDVREADEYAESHIESAINYPLSQFPYCLADLPKEPVYYVICRSGKRSLNACASLAERGYQAINVQGGMLAWKGEIVSSRSREVTDAS